MKSILESIRENAINECGVHSGGACGGSNYGYSFTACGGKMMAYPDSDDLEDYFVNDSIEYVSQKLFDSIRHNKSKSKDFLKNLIIYIADEALVGKNAQIKEVANMCKEIKKAMKW